MSRRNDQVIQEKAQTLDQHFEEILIKIEPYLLNLAASSESKLYRLWLERLNSADDQRNIRNEYLLEFYKQLKDGYLKEPFNFPPASGRLRPLPRSNRLVASSSCNELTETTISPTPQPFTANKRSIPKPRSKSLHRGDPRNLKPKFNPKLDVSLSSPNRSSHLADDDETARLSPSLRYHESNRSEKNLLKTYRERIDTLTTIIEELESQNEKLRCKLTYYHDAAEISNQVPDLQMRIEQLLGEVKNLKRKLKDVQNINSILEKNHKEIIQQYKIKLTNQFNSMKDHLAKARSENQELNSKIEMMEKKFQSLNQEKEETVKLDDFWLHEVESIKRSYEQMLRQKDMELKKKDDEVQQKDEELARKLEEIESMSETISELQQMVETKEQDEGNVESKLCDQYNSMKSELSEMRENIEQALKKQVENHQVEIHGLKRNVQKLEKLTQKLQEYEKKILHVVKKKDRQIRQMRLHDEHLKYSKLSKSIGDNYDAYFLTKYNELLHTVESKADLHRCKYIDRLQFLRNQWERLRCNINF